MALYRILLNNYPRTRIKLGIQILKNIFDCHKPFHRLLLIYCQLLSHMHDLFSLAIIGRHHEDVTLHRYFRKTYKNDLKSRIRCLNNNVHILTAIQNSCMHSSHILIV